MPSCEKDWVDIADETFKVWQFPNGIAAADGKHICIMNPAGGGSEYYNYKGFYSIVLMALVTFDYKFLYVDIGCQGRISDGGVRANTSFYKNLRSGQLRLPSPRHLPKPEDPVWEPHWTDQDMPFGIVGDKAFPLTENFMKPFPERGLDDRKGSG